MLLALVQFPAEADSTRMDAAFMGSADRYTTVPGLIRKYYLHSEDGITGGGAYLFESKEDAERLYTPEWHSNVRERYGQPAHIQYFRCPVVVDNVLHQIITQDEIREVNEA